MRGKLVVFEGLDRAGKSTQCQLLVKRLEREGHNVKYMRFPDRTTVIGKMIDQYLKGEAEQEDHVIHLLFSANRWEAANSIASLLTSGTTVVIDRYYYSGIVYSAAKDNPTLSLEWARAPDVGLPKPDICVFLDIDAEEAAKRGGFGEEKYESRKMQERVRELFKELRQRKGAEEMVRVDAGASEDVVEQRIWEQVAGCLKSVDEGELPLGKVEGW